MMCPHMHAPLNEYLDGTLGAHDRAAVAAHLAQCAGCRAALDELQALVTAARRLPREIEPPRDQWGAIAARIAALENTSRGGTAWWRQRVVFLSNEVCL